MESLKNQLKTLFPNVAKKNTNKNPPPPKQVIPKGYSICPYCKSNVRSINLDKHTSEKCRKSYKAKRFRKREQNRIIKSLIQALKKPSKKPKLSPKKQAEFDRLQRRGFHEGAKVSGSNIRKVT